jgi:mRNA-degrading endonuclease RelE of RelBE toxin-antitoxin system
MNRMSGDPRDKWKDKKRKREQERHAKEDQPPPPPPPPPRSQYRVEFSPEVEKEIDQLSGNVRTAMIDKLSRLKDWPEVTGIGHMWGEAKGLQRIKFWDWRAVFKVDDSAGVITVLKIGHRDTSYDEFH